MTDHKLVRRTHWDDSNATSSEWWELYEYRRGLFGKYSWQRVKVVSYAFDGVTIQVNAEGQREWAERIAKHYGIEVPDE